MKFDEEILHYCIFKLLNDFFNCPFFITELEEKDEKFQQVAKQLDVKTQESIRYKTAAEVAKVTIELSP